MNEHRLYYDDQTETVFGSFVEVYMHHIFNELHKKGGCDDTDEITKKLLESFPYNVHTADAIDTLNAKKYTCDCRALLILLEDVFMQDKHPLHPEPIWPRMDIFDPFCEHHKILNPRIRSFAEKLKKGPSVSMT